MSEANVVGARGTVTWLGHATLLLATNSGTRVVFDPWLENPKSPVGVDDLGEVDVIAVTHGHFDHMGSVVPLALATGATVVAIHELAGYFAGQGVENIVGMNKGGTVGVGDVSLTMVTADHSCGVGAGEGLPDLYGGTAAGFVAHLPVGEGGPIYVSGDTNVFSDMAIIRDLYRPDTAFLPIDGHYNMGPREAAYAVGLLGVRRLVPYHYGTFPMLTGTPDALAPLLAGTSTTLEAIDPGQSVTLN